MKAYGGVEIQLHAFLTSVLDGGEWSVLRSGHSTPSETALGTHWMGDWVGPRAGLDTVVKRKIPNQARNLSLRNIKVVIFHVLVFLSIYLYLRSQYLLSES
jgi:hypothetical protein